MWRCERSFWKHYGYRTITFNSIATPCKETTDSAEGMPEGNEESEDINMFTYTYSVNPGTEQHHRNRTEQATEEHESPIHI